MTSFVVGSLSRTTTLLPVRCGSPGSFKQIAGKTTLTLGSEMLLCGTDPLFKAPDARG